MVLGSLNRRSSGLFAPCCRLTTRRHTRGPPARVMTARLFLARHVGKHHGHKQSNANPTAVASTKAWSEHHQWSSLAELLHQRHDSGSCRSLLSSRAQWGGLLRALTEPHDRHVGDGLRLHLCHDCHLVLSCPPKRRVILTRPTRRGLGEGGLVNW